MLIGRSRAESDVAPTRRFAASGAALERPWTADAADPRQ